MNDDSLDQLVTLYRQHAREQSPSAADARILAAAELANKHRYRPALPLGLAAAALLAVTLSITMHTKTPNSTGLATHNATTLRAKDDATRAYLMQMDVLQASSPTAQYLMTGVAPDQ